MRKHKRGFTLIEVILFLAVTTALFVGIAAGVQGSIFQQRYTDSVQNYAEFLRSVYSQVSNVQNESTGRSDKAIYGKVITFREKKNWDGQGTRNEVRTYNLIGDVERSQFDGTVQTDDEAAGTITCGASVVERLKCLRANVIIKYKDEYGNSEYKPVGFVENYNVRWNAEVQTVKEFTDDQYTLYEGIVLVVHSPSSGNISTYVWDNQEGTEGVGDPNTNTSNVRDVIDTIENCVMDTGSCSNHDPFGTEGTGGTIWFTDSNFKPKDIDFCINPNGYEFSSVRRNIRLSSGAHNASAVDVLTEDTTTGNEMHKTTDYDHNRCK